MKRTQAALERLTVSPYWRETVLGQATPEQLQSVINSLVEEGELCLWLKPLHSEEEAGWKAEVAAMINFAVNFMDPVEDFVVLHSLSLALQAELLAARDEDLPALWARWIRSVRGISNKQGREARWKLILWAVNAGWNKELGSEPERRST